jgi:hypothetical protein
MVPRVERSAPNESRWRRVPVPPRLNKVTQHGTSGHPLQCSQSCIRLLAPGYAPRFGQRVRWENGLEDNIPENGTRRTMAVSKPQAGVAKWLVNWSLVRELRYADNLQSVSQQTGSSGWLRRKTGRVCRTRNFAASQNNTRLPLLGKFAGAFRKVVISDCE